MELYCNGNNLTTLDVSDQQALRGLECNSNQLAALDVSANVSLESLYCQDNQLEILLVSSSVTTLDCSNNRLYKLDLSRLSGALGSFGSDLTGQTVDLDVTGGVGNYSVPITLENPTFGDPAITYTPGSLNSTDNQVVSTSFDVGTGEQNNLRLEGVMNFTYLDDYTVTVLTDGNGTAAANVSSATQGTTITLTATPSAGYQLKEWQVVSGGVTIQGGIFTMPARNVVIRAVFEIPGASSASRRSSSVYDGRDTVTAKTQLPASAFSWDGDRTLTIYHERITALGLTKVEWDGVEVEDFIVLAGSVIIRFDRDFIGSQAMGEHTVRVEFLNHYGETTVGVGAAIGTTGDGGGTSNTHNPATGADSLNNPQTGDAGFGAVVWLAVLVLAVGLLTGCWNRLRGSCGR